MNETAEPADSILMPRFVLARAAQAGLDPDRLARRAGVPNWREGGEATRVSHRHCPRLWELAEEESNDAGLALRCADQSTVGELGVLEYLFLSAPTLGEALNAVIAHSGCLTTSYSMRLGDRTDREIVVELATAADDGRGRELLMHAAFALLLGRARWATRYPVVPTRVAFRQSAPAALGELVEFFGTATIDFAQSADSVTLRAEDLALPMKTADPDLAGVLRGYAATLPATPDLTLSWIDRLALVLDASLANGAATLDSVARQLHTSPRSLQRRLTDSGTSWRHELDRARLRRFEQAAHLSRARQAELLGYADPASLRRAVARWQRHDPG
ncbi:AraC family transcriptional regulator ligand-binding domain-containing protein [Nocardia sp. NPDC127526]|uniref:AraC family transcriptional regulator n=1 Tax=Nocardia sp. NPDC127526 TaxID=3345393 RepID=UPI0036408080